MSARVQCPECQKPYRVSEGSLGGTAVCKYCRSHFTLVATTAGTVERKGAVLNKEQRRPRDSSRNSPYGSPSQLGRFTICQLLGEGCFGTVYRARDTVLERDVALKVPKRQAFESQQALARHLREAQATAKLHHANIVPIYDVGTANDNCFIASAYIAGRTLEDTLRQRHLSIETSVGIAIKLAHALDHAHSHGVVHRDVKPANILLDKDDEPYLMDFGLAILRESSSRLTQKGAILGTPLYMSPEQAGASVGAVGPPSDEYSLACVLYEMLCGRPPFCGTPMSVIYQHRETPVTPPISVNSGVSQSLSATCCKALSKRVAHRFAGLADFAHALEYSLIDTASSGDQATRQVTQLSPPPGRSADATSRSGSMAGTAYRRVLRTRRGLFSQIDSVLQRIAGPRNTVLLHALRSVIPLSAIALSALIYGYVHLDALRPTANLVQVENERREGQPAFLKLIDIADQRIPEGGTLNLRVALAEGSSEDDTIRFALTGGAPQGCTLDAVTGQLTWTPTESQGPSQSRFEVNATSTANGLAQTSTSFTVVVDEVNEAPVIEPISDQEISVGATLRLQIRATDVDLPVTPLLYSLRSSPASATIDSRFGVVSWIPSPEDAGKTCAFVVRVTETGDLLSESETKFQVRVPAPVARSNQPSEDVGSPLELPALAHPVPVMNAISQRGDYSFHDARLIYVMQFLSRKHGTHFKLDSHAFLQASIDPHEILISAECESTRLQDLLDDMLPKSSLQWYIDDDGIAITTLANADSLYWTYVYKITKPMSKQELMDGIPTRVGILGKHGRINVVSGNALLVTERAYWHRQLAREYSDTLQLVTSPVGGKKSDPFACGLIRMEFVETPLRNTTAFLAKTTGIQIEVDDQSLEEVGLVRSVPLPVTCKLHNVNLPDALKTVLSSFSGPGVFESRLVGGKIVISTPEGIEQLYISNTHQTQRLWGGSNAKEVLNEVVPHVGLSCWSRFGGSVKCTLGPNGSIIVFGSKHDQEELSKLLRDLKEAIP